MNRVIQFWDEYDKVIVEYANKSLPELIDPPPVPTSHEGDNYKVYREKLAEICNQNKKISQIRFIILNYKEIEMIIEYLNITFKFTKTQIRENISFYDRIFQLPLEKVNERVTYFIELFGSGELFLEAMFTGTPLTETTGYKEFCGIMNYTNINIENKLTALANELELSRLDAAKIFVYHSSYMYCSPQTLAKSLDYLCKELSVSKKELGVILMKCPSLIYNANGKQHTSEINFAINRLKEIFFLSKEEALIVIRYYPKIVKRFWESICELAEKNDKNIPEIICKKPWLYNLYDIARYYNGYDYGNYNEILEHFECLEKRFGKITKVHFRKMQPLTKSGKKVDDEILYTVILIQVKDNPNTHLFVSFGCGYKTSNYITNRIMREVFGTGCFSELLVFAPMVNSSEYDTVLDNIFQMCAMGYGDYLCEYNLNNGYSLVIDKLNNDELKILDIPETTIFEKYICDFKTVRAIPNDEIENFKNQRSRNYSKDFINSFFKQNLDTS